MKVLFYVGKGITDQDRNILAHQVLILGFLRAVPSVLKKGPVPQITAVKKKKSKDDDEDDEEEDQDKDMGSEDGQEQDVPPVNLRDGTRGTVLITLRNVIPYTLWFVSFIFLAYHA